MHLVTAAMGAEKYYTLKNNEARYETKEQARSIDQKIAQMWVSHPNVAYIDNSAEGFEGKMDRLVNVVSNLVGLKIPNYTKKYLVRNTENCKIPNDLRKSSYVDVLTFIVRNKKEEIKWLVRRTEVNNPFSTYFLVTRIYGNEYSKRIETNQVLSERIYNELKGQADPHNI